MTSKQLENVLEVIESEERGARHNAEMLHRCGNRASAGYEEGRTQGLCFAGNILRKALRQVEKND
jgi:hypothetical protein